MRIEPARPEDARAVAAVHVRSWQAAYPGIVPAAFLVSLSIDEREAMWRQSIEDGVAQMLIAREAADAGDAVLGWVSFGTLRDEDARAGDAEIWAIYVDAPAWGRGVGRALWQAVLSRLRVREFTSVSLWCFPRNTRAIRFYEALGFVAEPGSERTFMLEGAEMREIRYSMRI